MALADAETERWRRRFGMSRRAVRPHRGRHGDRLLGDRRGRPAAGSATTRSAHNTDDHRRLRPRVGPAARGRDACATCPASSSSTSSRTTSTPTGCGGSTTPPSTRSSPRIWPQASPVTGDQPGIRPDGSIRGGGAGEIDPIENLSRFHYLKELFLDSATTTDRAVVRADLARHRTTRCRSPRRPRRSRRSTSWRDVRSAAVMHAFVMPNRGSGSATATRPAAGEAAATSRRSST